MLEPCWLRLRKASSPEAPFFQGLIQLAAAFLHLERHSSRRPRLAPATRLLRRAHSHLEPFAPAHRSIALAGLLDLIATWLRHLEGPSAASARAQLPPPLIQERPAPD